LWDAAVRLEGEVRFWDGMAELLRATRGRGDGSSGLLHHVLTALRGAMHGLPGTPWARFRRWAAADGSAILHERCSDEI
jgi:hypothetical protein